MGKENEAAEGLLRDKREIVKEWAGRRSGFVGAGG